MQTYTLPLVRLVNQDGIEMDLSAFLASNKFVVVDFIFTTCTTICPVLSAGLVNFHKTLGEEADNVKFISISIDPEHDKPDVLKAYSRNTR